MVWITSILSARSSIRTSSLRTFYCVLEMPTSGAWLLKPQSGSSQGPSPHPAPQVPRACVGTDTRTLDLNPYLNYYSFFLSPPLTPSQHCPPGGLGKLWHPFFPCLRFQSKLDEAMSSELGSSATVVPSFELLKSWVPEKRVIRQCIMCSKLPLVANGPTTTSMEGYCAFPKWLLQAASSRAGSRQGAV